MFIYHALHSVVKKGDLYKVLGGWGGGVGCRVCVCILILINSPYPLAAPKAEATLPGVQTQLHTIKQCVTQY